MKYFLRLLFVFPLLLTSCKKEADPQNTTAPTNIVPFTEVGRQMQSQSQTATQQQNVSTNPAPTGSVAKGLNPAHGQPGHRCDIAVGAPLNTTAITTTNKPVIQEITPQQNQQVPTSTPVTIPTAEGMNPPHGQTNHRCDVAVGAPLPKE